MKYFVTVGDESVVVIVDGDRVVIDGVPVVATLEREPGSPLVRVIIDGEATLMAVEERLAAGWRLVDGGDVREAAIEDERARHIRLLTGPAHGASSATRLKSPMPGLVARVPVAVGDRVAAGAPLVVLSAMKMENELKATAPVVVTAILVAAGEAVEKGAVLLELEPIA
jgi:biotin carboxyl carrier protein